MNREFSSLGNQIAKLQNFQVRINGEALKFKFRERNGSLIFLADHCFKQVSNVASQIHSLLRKISCTKYYLLFHIQPASAFF